MFHYYMDSRRNKIHNDGVHMLVFKCLILRSLRYAVILTSIFILSLFSLTFFPPYKKQYYNENNITESIEKDTNNILIYETTKTIKLFSSFKNTQHVKHRVKKNTEQIKRHFLLKKLQKPGFLYLYNLDSYCENNSPYVLNIVLSAPLEKDIRNLIRGLWGHPIHKMTTGHHVIFLLGMSQTKERHLEIMSEARYMNDMVVFDFLDTYNNLTLKTLAGLSWVRDYCPLVQWVMKSDTDVFVNSYAVNRFLKNLEMLNPLEELERQIICKKKESHILYPCRGRSCPTPKWEVPWSEYPFHMYPNHCYGPAYIFKRSLFHNILEGSYRTKYFRLEDIYFTGIVPLIVGGVRRKDIGKKFPWRPKAWSSEFTSALLILELETGLGAGSSEQLWKKVLTEI